MTFDEHLERDSEIVASWPAWKQGVLGASMQSTNAAPRSVNSKDYWRLRHLFRVIERLAHQDGSVDFIELIARLRGWQPLDKGEEMIVHFLGREYRIQRTE